MLTLVEKIVSFRQQYNSKAMKLSKKLSRMIVFILHIFGLWSKPTMSLMAYRCYSCAIHFTFSFMYLTCMITHLITIDDVNEATYALFPTLTIVAYSFKVMNFHLHAYGMQKILADIMEFEFEKDNEIKLANDKLEFLYKLAVCYLTMGHATIILAFVRVLFINNSLVLPLPSWYPLDWQNVALYYWIVYVYQMVGAFLILNVNAALDLYSIFLMAMITKQMEILGERFANVTMETKRECSYLHSTSNKKERINAELISCIKVHQNLLRIIGDIESNFSIGTFFQISLSGVNICSAVYQLTILSPFVELFRFGYCLGFFITLIVQIFMTSYFGDKILAASTSLTNSAYSSSWYAGSVTFRKNLLILMVRLNRESELLAGKLFPMNLTLFSTIMNFSYRLYAILAR